VSRKPPYGLIRVGVFIGVLRTAVPEVDRGLPDGLKVIPNLRVGVEISLDLILDLIPGLALEAGEKVVHVGVGG
jgi:hypothetical protein